MNLLGSWRNATELLSRLSGNGANATVFMIAANTPHRLQTTLTPAQEAVAVALRKTLLVSLDDLLAVVREFLNPNVSRSGLDRCLRRHGVGRLRDLKAKDDKPKHSGFKAYDPGYIHIDVKYLPQMANETSRGYLFVAIDRASRWVFIAVYRNKTAANARRFLRDLERACPIHIRTILTDNVLYAELLAGLASGHYRIEVSRHVHSMAQFGFLVNDSLSHNKHRVRFCGSHRP